MGLTVSLCVVAYNEQKNLESLFEDIGRQDYPHNWMEIILVDGMSQDNTKRMMEEFAKKNEYKFRNVLVEENKKRIQAAGWNTAIRASSGEVIIRIDAHAHIPNEFVRKNIECLSEGEYVSGGPRPNVVPDETPWKHTLLLAESSMFGSSIASYRRKAEKRRYVKSLFHGAYRREVFDKAGLFNESLGRTEDNEMHYRILKEGFRICYDPEIISYQHIRSSWPLMIKQKYGNGYWIGLTVGECPECLACYHFVPGTFTAALAVSAVLYACGVKWPFKLIAGAYIAADAVMTISSVYGEKKHPHFFLLPFIFFSLHISYGAGTLAGLAKMPFWRGKKRKSVKEKIIEREKA